VIGHSDRTGSQRARRLVSIRRAGAIRDLLISAGVPARLISAAGVADTQLSVETPDHVREPNNRRAELRVEGAPLGGPC
jgi:outer membrane protein OmpA-like peptidoglycan-associated protein